MTQYEFLLNHEDMATAGARGLLAEAEIYRAMRLALPVEDGKNHVEERKENFEIKKWLRRSAEISSGLIKEWDEAHMPETQAILGKWELNLQDMIDAAFELDFPDEEIMQMTFALGQKKIFIRKHVLGADCEP